MIVFASTADPISEGALRHFRDITRRQFRTKELPVGATAIRRQYSVWPWLTLLGAGLWVVMQLIRMETKGPEFLVIGSFVLIVGLLLRWMFFVQPAYEQIARSHAPFAYEELADDKRLPVVLLRPFRDDTAKTETSWFKRRRVEEVVVETAKGYGPVIAIGAPEENELPRLGAARAYIPGDNAWSAVALEWMQASRMIVMMAGQSPGLMWELDRIIQLGLLGKLVVVCHNNSAYDRQIWKTRPLDDGPLQMAMRLARAAGSGDVPRAADLDDVIAMFVDDGRLVLVRTAKFNGDAHDRSLKYAVERLFCQT